MKKKEFKIGNIINREYQLACQRDVRTIWVSNIGIREDTLDNILKDFGDNKKGRIVIDFISRGEGYKFKDKEELKQNFMRIYEENQHRLDLTELHFEFGDIKND